MDISTEGPTEKKTCVVVDEEDRVLHIGGLAKCHVRPMTLHRAFSLFVFDKQGRLLLQQRAKSKYTFPLAWTNTVCSHPRNLEKAMEEWIDIRIQDELGWAIKDIQNRLTVVGKLTYSAISDATYGEKEIDTLYVLEVQDSEKSGINLNRAEVEAIDWVEPERLERILGDDRMLVTPWFRAIANGFGHPFSERVRQPWEDRESFRDPEDDKSSRSSRSTSASSDSSVVTTFVQEPSGKVLPWFRVGDCSMPRANASNDFLLQAPFSYLCSNPGKAVRSELVKLYAEYDRLVAPEDVTGLCSIVERIHNASLLHDDIEDKSSSRRGAVCSHLLWGVAQTINAGTFNFLKAAQSVDAEMAHRSEAVRSRLMRQVLETMLDLHRGQNADICWGENSMCPSVNEYMEMIDHKTGALFSACATFGSVCSGNAERGESAARLLLELGRFFQVRDDLCNICDPAYWKAKGFYEDADEGKMSYPVLALLEKTPNDERSERDADWLRKRLCDKSTPLPMDDKLRAYDILFHSESLQATKAFCLESLEQLRSSEMLSTKRGEQILQLLYVPDVLDPERVRAELRTI